jgi:hypothetical protein
MFRILQGTLGIIFRVAIAKSAAPSRSIVGIGVFAGVASIVVGLTVTYLGFSIALGVLGLS